MMCFYSVYYEQMMTKSQMMYITQNRFLLFLHSKYSLHVKVKHSVSYM